MRYWLAMLVATVSLGCGAAAAATAAPDSGRETGAAACPSPADKAREDWPGEARWRALEEAGYRLGALSVRVDDVYTGTGLAWYQRLANRLHANTEATAIRDLLTVAPGDPVSATAIYEAERVLRRQRFLTGARIIPTHCDGEQVAAEVRVRDAWTLKLGASVGQAGGESESSAGIVDENILGTGKTISLSWSEERDRTTVQFGYEDRAFWGSQWTLGLQHSDFSDGRGNAVSVDYPFRTSDQRWGVRSAYEERHNELDFDEAGETAYTAELETEDAHLEVLRHLGSEASGGWRAGLGWRRDYADYSALQQLEPGLRPQPALDDRRLQGPYLVAERFSARYRSFRNLRAIGQTEDYDLGLDARLVGGRYTEGRGEPWFYEVELSHGLAIGQRDLLVTELTLSGRQREPSGQDATYRAVASDYYHRTSRRNTIVVHGEYDWRDQPDPEDELYLGGFDGLLAYPDQFRSGDRRWLVHLEDRYVSDVVLFDTIQMGYTAYLEAGRIRGLDGRWSRTLADVGAGLRLGSLRSSFGTVAYLTVARPLVDAGQEAEYSIVVGSTVNF